MTSVNQKRILWMAMMGAVAGFAAVVRPVEATMLVCTADTVLTEYSNQPPDPPTIFVPEGEKPSIWMRYSATASSSSERLGIILLRFDLTGLSGTVVNNAQLNLTSSRNHSTDYQVNLLGVAHANAGWWDEATTARDSAWINNDGVNNWFFFNDGDENSLADEASDYLYDRWDLVPNGDTDTARMLAVELVGTADTPGVAYGVDTNQTLSMTSAQLISFLQAAIDRGDPSVTFVLATRSANTFQYKFYSREATDDLGVGGEDGDTLVTDAMRPNLVINEPFCPQYPAMVVDPTDPTTFEVDRGYLPTPANVKYTIVNLTAAAANYTLTVLDDQGQTVPWLTLTQDPADSSAAPYTPAMITVAFNNAVKSLAVGTYHVYVTIIGPCGFTTQRQIDLIVNQPQGLNLNLIASADTTLNDFQNSPTEPTTTLVAQGDSVQVWVRYRSGTGSAPRNDVALFRFDTAALHGSRIVSAALKLTSLRDSNPDNQVLNLFGIYAANSGNWDESTVIRTSPEINNNNVFDPPEANNQLFLFNDGPENTLHTSWETNEANDYMYDRWDLVPNGETDNTHLMVQELVGTAADGKLFGVVALNTPIIFDEPTVGEFLQQALDNGDSTVTFMMTTRLSSGTQMNVYSRTAAVIDDYKPQLMLTYIPCHAPFADANGDGDVDQEDFAQWQTCFTGPFAAIPGAKFACKCFDSDNDGSISSADLGSFLNCFSGPGVPALADCGAGQ